MAGDLRRMRLGGDARPHLILAFAAAIVYWRKEVVLPERNGPDLDEVPEDVLVGGLDYIRNMVGNAPDIEQGQGQDMAYALYVLARAGRAPVGDLEHAAARGVDGARPRPRSRIAFVADIGNLRQVHGADEIGHFRELEVEAITPGRRSRACGHHGEPP